MKTETGLQITALIRAYLNLYNVPWAECERIGKEINEQIESAGFLYTDTGINFDKTPDIKTTKLLEKQIQLRESLLYQAINAINNMVIDYQASKSGKITQSSYLLAKRAIADFIDAKTFINGKSVWKDTGKES